MHQICATADRCSRLKGRPRWLGTVGWQKAVVIALPLLLFMVSCGLGLWAVFGQSINQARSRQRMAGREALRYTSRLELVMQNVFVPARALEMFVRSTPGHNVADMQGKFDAWAHELLGMTGWEPTGLQNRMNLQLLPSGVVTHIHPLSGNQVVLGKDVLSDPVIGPVVLTAAERQSHMLEGPFFLRQGYLGVLVTVPVFVEGDWPRDETFGAPKLLPPTCGDFCFNSTHRNGKRLWGFVMAVVRWDGLLDSMQFRFLEEAGYHYRLVRPWIPQDGPNGTQEFILGQSAVLMGRDLRTAIRLPVNVPGNTTASHWALILVPRKPFMPKWRWPAMAGVVVGTAVAFALLWALLETNRRLRATGSDLNLEKERMDALLRRQYDLIKCLGGAPSARSATSLQPGRPPGGGDGGAGGDSGTGAGGDGGAGGEGCDALRTLSGSSHVVVSTADGIQGAILAEMARSAACAGRRRASDAATGAAGADIVLLELLGQGTYGKVYRGLWRGSPVAVKTLLLPASLSPGEKREKMVVMETAIASSMSHPNIVQTYTYSIRPLCDSTFATEAAAAGSSAAGIHSLGSAAVVGWNEGSLLPSLGGQPRVCPATQEPCALSQAPSSCHTGPTSGSPGRGVHSFELQLVLEFCDLGSLRNALNNGAFTTAQGQLNLAAVLDTAADVARAMAHLHVCSVVHGDLKATNVMLKSSGSDGRGAVAKVVDFGLSVRMEAADSHVSHMFQGTLSHMAPEVLMEGRLGKASDVYAFAITVYEMFTGGMPYTGMPRALLPHRVVADRLRPPLPPAMPPTLRRLLTVCWAHEPLDRPPFENILKQLVDMRSVIPGPTPPLNIRNPFPSERGRAAPSHHHSLQRLHKLQDPGTPGFIQTGETGQEGQAPAVAGPSSPAVMVDPARGQQHLIGDHSMARGQGQAPAQPLGSPPGASWASRGEEGERQADESGVTLRESESQSQAQSQSQPCSCLESLCLATTETAVQSDLQPDLQPPGSHPVTQHLPTQQPGGRQQAVQRQQQLTQQQQQEHPHPLHPLPGLFRLSPSMPRPTHTVRWLPRHTGGTHRGFPQSDSSGDSNAPPPAFIDRDHWHSASSGSASSDGARTPRHVAPTRPPYSVEFPTTPAKDPCQPTPPSPPSPAPGTAAASTATIPAADLATAAAGLGSAVGGGEEGERACEGASKPGASSGSHSVHSVHSGAPKTSGRINSSTATSGFRTARGTTGSLSSSCPAGTSSSLPAYSALLKSISTGSQSGSPSSLLTDTVQQAGSASYLHHWQLQVPHTQPHHGDYWRQQVVGCNSPLHASRSTDWAGSNQRRQAARGVGVLSTGLPAKTDSAAEAWGGDVGGSMGREEVGGGSMGRDDVGGGSMGQEEAVRGSVGRDDVGGGMGRDDVESPVIVLESPEALAFALSCAGEGPWGWGGEGATPAALIGSHGPVTPSGGGGGGPCAGPSRVGGSSQLMVVVGKRRRSLAKRSSFASTPLPVVVEEGVPAQGRDVESDEPSAS